MSNIEVASVGGEYRNKDSWFDEESLSMDASKYSEIGVVLESSSSWNRENTIGRGDDDSATFTIDGPAAIDDRDVDRHRGLSFYDYKRLSNMDRAMPFFLTTRHFVDGDDITFVSAAVCDDLSSRIVRGKLYRTRVKKRRYAGAFVSNSEVDRSSLWRLTGVGGIPKRIVSLLEEDIASNAKYESESYRVDPARIVSFIYRRCSESADANRVPLIVTWQSFRDLIFLRNHVLSDKRLVRCSISDYSCRDRERRFDGDSSSGRYFTLDDRGRTRIICDSRYHRAYVDGLVNPIWINMSTRRRPEDGAFVLDFKYDNRLTICSVPLGEFRTHKRHLNVEEAHSLIGCDRTHENASCVSGVVSHAKCIFSKYSSELFRVARDIRKQ